MKKLNGCSIIDRTKLVSATSRFYFSSTFKFPPKARRPTKFHFTYSQRSLTIHLLEGLTFPRDISPASVERIRCSTMRVSATYISRCPWNSGEDEWRRGAVQFQARAGNHDNSKHVHGRTRCWKGPVASESKPDGRENARATPLVSSLFPSFPLYNFTPTITGIYI